LSESFLCSRLVVSICTFSPFLSLPYFFCILFILIL
jgi:hypothetical protein